MKNNLKWVLSLVLCAIITFGVTFAYTQGALSYGHRDPKLNANVFVLHESVGGKQELASGNLITNIGEAYVRDALGFGNCTGTSNQVANLTNVIGVGNATTAPAVGDLELDEVQTTNGFARANGTVVAWYNTTANNYAFNVTKTFTCTTAATYINCTGLYWGYGSTCLFAIAAIAGTTFQISDNCTITWVLTFQKS